MHPARRTHGAARSLLPPQPPLGPPAGEGLPASPTVASCFQHVLAACRRSGRERPGRQPPAAAAAARSAPAGAPASPLGRHGPLAPAVRASRRPTPVPGHAVLPVPRRVPRRDRREYPSPRLPRVPPPAAPLPAAPRPLRPSPPPRPLFARNGPGAPGSSRAAGPMVAVTGRLEAAEPEVDRRLAAS